MTNHIPFNKPFIAEDSLLFVRKVINSERHSGNGIYSNRVTDFFQKNYIINKCLLTSSCTDALEMAALLLNIERDDEIILPSYTFVSTANAFALRGAKLVFCDSESNFPNIDAPKIESLITEKTKAIVVVHYAGFACDMQKILSLSKKYNLFVVEDAAQAIDSYYVDNLKNKIPLGTIGDFGTLSFHETKNISCGEGGLLMVNNSKFIDQSNIVLEKGTNRAKFIEGKVNKYQWVGLGSSFLPSEFTAAILYSQLKIKDRIISKRLQIWNRYHDNLVELQNDNQLREIRYPLYSTNNAHMYFIVTKSFEERENLINYLKDNKISAVSHYLSLNKSPFFLKNNPKVDLKNSDMFSNCLLRLPLFYDLRIKEVDYICSIVKNFYIKNS